MKAELKVAKGRLGDPTYIYLRVDGTALVVPAAGYDPVDTPEMLVNIEERINYYESMKEHNSRLLKEAVQADALIRDIKSSLDMLDLENIETLDCRDQLKADMLNSIVRSMKDYDEQRSGATNGA